MSGPLQHVNAMQPVGRVGEVNEVAETVRVPASDATSFLMGVRQPMDGRCRAL